MQIDCEQRDRLVKILIYSLLLEKAMQVPGAIDSLVTLWWRCSSAAPRKDMDSGLQGLSRTNPRWGHHCRATQIIDTSASLLFFNFSLYNMVMLIWLLSTCWFKVLLDFSVSPLGSARNKIRMQALFREVQMKRTQIYGARDPKGSRQMRNIVISFEDWYSTFWLKGPPGGLQLVEITQFFFHAGPREEGGPHSAVSGNWQLAQLGMKVGTAVSLQWVSWWCGGLTLALAGKGSILWPMTETSTSFPSDEQHELLSISSLTIPSQAAVAMWSSLVQPQQKKTFGDLSSHG